MSATNKPKVTIVSGIDWEGMYVDGVLKVEGHSVDVECALEAVGLEVGCMVANQSWLEDEGSLPEQLKDVKRA
jgi:hypothetical protein